MRTALIPPSPLEETIVLTKWLLLAADRFHEELVDLLLPNLAGVQAAALRGLLRAQTDPSVHPDHGALRRVSEAYGIGIELFEGVLGMRLRLRELLRDEPDLSSRAWQSDRFTRQHLFSPAWLAGALGTALKDPRERFPFLMPYKPERSASALQEAHALLASVTVQRQLLARHVDASGRIESLAWILDQRTLLVGGERWYLAWNLFQRGWIRPCTGAPILDGPWQLIDHPSVPTFPERRILLPDEWRSVAELVV